MMTISSFPRFSNLSPSALIAELIAELNRRAVIAGKYIALRSRALPTFDILLSPRIEVPD